MSPESKKRQQQEQMRAAVDRKAQSARARAAEDSLEAADRPPEAIDPRAKNSGHRKKTADKWNQ